MDGQPRAGAEPGRGDGAPEGSPLDDPGDAAALMADVSRALATEPEPDRALALLLDRLVPAMADWGTIRLRDFEGGVRRVAARHRDPAKAELVAQLLGTVPFAPPDDDVVDQLFADRRTLVIDGTDPTVLAIAEPDPETRELWGRLGLGTIAVVPLMASAQAWGAVVLVRSEGSGPFDPTHLRIAESLAVQCTLLVQNTRLVRAAEVAATERRSVRTLLDSLLAHASVATAVFDTDLRVVHANDSFAALGNGEDGVPIAEALPDLAAQVVPLVREALDGGRSVEGEAFSPGPGSTRRSWQVSAFPVLRDGGGRFGAGLFLSDVTEERQVARRLSESLARLDLSLAVGGLARWDWDFFADSVMWSGRLDEVLGLPPAAYGRSPADFLAVVHPDERDRHRDGMIAAARAASDYQAEIRVLRADGEERWLEIRGRTLTNARGEPRRMIGVAADVTDRHLVEEIKAELLEREHRARVEAEDARERLALIAEVSAGLISTLDPATALATVPDLVVPRICDWCVVDAVTPEGEVVEVALVHRDAASEADVRASRRLRHEAGGDGIWSVRRAVRTATSELVLGITDDDLSAAASDADHAALLLRLAPRSAIVVPLVARGRVLGGLTLVATHDRRFEPDDLTLVENLAARLAMAVDNARLFDSRSQVARALQQTLLPPALPVVPHMDVAARYRVAAGGIDIGGDFYDLFELRDGAWAVVVGDVCGKGPEAAAVTGMFRHTLRAVAVHEGSPAGILAGTNRAILGHIDDTRFCTAALLRVDPAEGRARVTVACGGHPRPFVVRAEGAIERVEAPGTLLGVLPDPVLTEQVVELAGGDAVVLYTDGVTEARSGTEQFGEGRLVEALSAAVARGTDAGLLADAVEEAVDEFCGGVPGDDVAILVVRATPVPPPG